MLIPAQPWLGKQKDLAPSIVVENPQPQTVRLAKAKEQLLQPNPPLMKVILHECEKQYANEETFDSNKPFL